MIVMMTINNHDDDDDGGDGVVVIQVGPTYLCRQLTRLRQNVLSAVITSPHFIFLNEHYFLIDWTSIPQRFYLVYFILEKAASGFPAVLCPSPPPGCSLNTRHRWPRLIFESVIFNQEDAFHLAHSTRLAKSISGIGVCLSF